MIKNTWINKFCGFLSVKKFIKKKIVVALTFLIFLEDRKKKKKNNKNVKLFN